MRVFAEGRVVGDGQVCEIFAVSVIEDVAVKRMVFSKLNFIFSGPELLIRF